jgi:predicted GNAT superfamily acetyltransferase
MPNGMENDNITYKTITGFPSKKIFAELTELYVEIFEDADLEFFGQRFNALTDLLTLLAYHNGYLVGFKVGYRYDALTFYSWIGGVKLIFRNKGIAKQLALLQEQQAKQHGYTKLRTKSMNRFKAMMIMNLKNGFDIKKIYTNTKGQTKIVFEKTIE